MTVKIVTIVGARPQFVKAGAVSRLMAGDERFDEVLIHTGQHHDDNMSGVFFEEFGIPRPAHNLNISGGAHGAMTGRMIAALEEVLIEERPDAVLVYGDTNSTLAGALAAVKLHIPIVHVEAGLRSFNNRMPEEINRVVVDRISSLLLCPTETAVANLAQEGIVDGVENVGDVMYDVALFYREAARTKSTILSDLGIEGRRFALATCHRAENTDDTARLAEIVDALAAIASEMPVVFPLHPRTRKLIAEYGLEPLLSKIKVLAPVSFLDMVALEQAAALILTDSGGVQKEAFFYDVPCVTMRDETEWVETVALGRNILAGANRHKIVDAALSFPPLSAGEERPYGSGNASQKILSAILTLK